jgi:hypothetical protein
MRSYDASASLHWQRIPALELLVKGYCQYKDAAPFFGNDPAQPWWHPELQTSLWSRGASLQADLVFNAHLSFRTIADVGRAQRIENGHVTPYEWDVPWSSKSILMLQPRDRTVKMFLTGYVAAGLPYRRLVFSGDRLVITGPFERVPVYKRIDFQIQVNQPIEDHRFLTRFDGFVEITNILDLVSMAGVNVREYYWDEQLRQLPVTLQPFTIHIGLRAGFRL